MAAGWLLIFVYEVIIVKRRAFLALGLTAALSIPFAMTAFADESQYKAGQTVEFSGQTDFDYYYTYTNDQTNYKCFSVIENGQRWYAAVTESWYEYCKNAFANQPVAFNGKFQNVAGDGAPVVLIEKRIQTNEKGEKTTTDLRDCIWAANCGTSTSPNFKLFDELYSAGTTTIADDSSYIKIDSNPLNAKSGSFFEYMYRDPATRNIKLMNELLVLPDWVYEEMMATKAIDGRQKETFDNVTVTWSYSPNQGLEVVYRLNK
mgnify:FL=1|jgi:hypothetical protein|nr:MAG TPA: hypothetical protein [Caudoviricetes sp.]